MNKPWLEDEIVGDSAVCSLWLYARHWHNWLKLHLKSYATHRRDARLWNSEEQDRLYYRWRNVVGSYVGFDMPPSERRWP